MLAHWIMGDGQAHHSGLIVCTHSYTVQQVVLLMNVLMVKYSIECTLRMDHGKYPRPAGLTPCGLSALGASVFRTQIHLNGGPI